MEFSLIY